LNYATYAYTKNGFSYNNEVLSWDSKTAGIKILLAQITGQAYYLQEVEKLCDTLLSVQRFIFFLPSPMYLLFKQGRKLLARVNAAVSFA